MTQHTSCRSLRPWSPVPSIRSPELSSSVPNSEISRCSTCRTSRRSRGWVRNWPRVRTLDVAVGRPSLLTDLGFRAVSTHGCARFDEIAASGNTTFLAGWDGEVRGVVSVADTVRPSSVACHRRASTTEGLSTAMLTGDTAVAAARRVGDDVGIDMVIADVLPGEKADVIVGLQRDRVRSSRSSAMASTTLPR